MSGSQSRVALDAVDARLDRDGFTLLLGAVPTTQIHELLIVCVRRFEAETAAVRARSSRGHVYAARNLIEGIPEILSVCLLPKLIEYLSEQLGDHFGLVRALFFDKPPDRTWTLGWHKDTAIAVQDHGDPSEFFSRPTVKAGVPHLVACDDVLRGMLTLRIHLDDVTGENGPLRVIPESHHSSVCEGRGVENAVTIFASAGDVLAMRPLLSHASGASKEGTLRHRRILHLEFASEEELPGGIQWKHFVAPAKLNATFGTNDAEP